LGGLSCSPRCGGHRETIPHPETSGVLSPPWTVLIAGRAFREPDATLVLSLILHGPPSFPMVIVAPSSYPWLSTSKSEGRVIVCDSAVEALMNNVNQYGISSSSSPT
jgi:hypothetical protein